MVKAIAIGNYQACFQHQTEPNNTNDRTKYSCNRTCIVQCVSLPKAIDKMNYENKH